MCLATFTGAAHAEPKYFFGLFRSHDHWRDLDFQPHLQNAKHPQNSQWSHGETYQGWTAETWGIQRGGLGPVIETFFRNKIFTDKYTKNDLPAIEVGPNFYRLSGFDKRRVIKTVDKYYQVTARAGALYLYDWHSAKPVGVYTRSGLQLQ